MVRSKRLFVATMLAAALAPFAAHAAGDLKKFLPPSTPPACDASCQLSRQAQQDAAKARVGSNRAVVPDTRHDFPRVKVAPNTSVGGDYKAGAPEINIRRTY